ncbi:MAG: hypothetical protein LC725_11835, partial [Lentisphaerae bacterium]|nr:hypothetical protein [Lentisphaerota bacterium]
MKISDLVVILEGQVVCCEDKLGCEIGGFAASDLLSDILAFEQESYALLTGLTNVQVLRTAEITSAHCVVILRGKQPQPAAVALARRSGVPLILSDCGMFEACCRICR